MRSLMNIMDEPVDERIDLDRRRTLAVSSLDDGIVWLGAENGQESVALNLTRQQAAQLAALLFKAARRAPWLPIETAPRDGSWIMLGVAGDDDRAEVSTMGWWQEAEPDQTDVMGHDAGFIDVMCDCFRPGRSFGNPTSRYEPRQPTHWMPLPPPPETNS